MFVTKGIQTDQAKNVFVSNSLIRDQGFDFLRLGVRMRILLNRDVLERFLDDCFDKRDFVPFHSLRIIDRDQLVGIIR